MLSRFLQWIFIRPGRRGRFFGVSCLFIAALAAACAIPPTATQALEQPAATSSPMPTETSIPPTPTPTPEPLALRVNGEGITQAEFEAELGQFQEADKELGKNTPAGEQRQIVFDNLIATLLLAQGATKDGYTLSDAELQAEIERIAREMGGEQPLLDWMAKYGYTASSFPVTLRRQLAAAWERDRIADQTPQVAEQIHARQILTQDETIANRALEQVKVPGVNFAAQARRYDPVTGGDLGWFPRGYLTQKEVEDVAFQLQPGEISGVIKSQIGYHIIQVIARDPARPLSEDARRVLQHKAIQDWLNKQREIGQVEVLLP